MIVKLKKEQKIKVTKAEDIFPIMKDILLRENRQFDGIFEIIKESDRFIDRYVKEERFKTKYRDEGRKERDVEIARNLLSVGLEIDDIIKSTGLSKEEIENLK